MALEALAFAGARNSSDGAVPFAIKARLSYAAALTLVRSEIINRTSARTTEMLVSVLLLDQFEVSADNLALSLQML